MSGEHEALQRLVAAIEREDLHPVRVDTAVEADRLSKCFHPLRRDHACKECVEDATGPPVLRGFRCAYHAAKDVLTAPAHELLTALEALLAAHLEETAWGDGVHEKHVAAVKAAQAAIAKARST